MIAPPDQLAPKLSASPRIFPSPKPRIYFAYSKIYSSSKASHLIGPRAVAGLEFVQGRPGPAPATAPEVAEHPASRVDSPCTACNRRRPGLGSLRERAP